MSANVSMLVPSRERGWRMGLANMLAKENRAWWGTRRWWILCLLGLILLNGGMVPFMGANLDIITAFQNFLSYAGLAVPIAAILLGQDAILGEKHSGTAAWVLSKPLRRLAFLLAKLIAHGLGFLVTAVVLPGVVAYFYILIVGKLALPIAGFAGAMGLVYLNLLFYLTLTLMLATLFDGRGPVMGIALFLVWFWMIPPVPYLMDIMPWRLLIPLGKFNEFPALGGYLATGAPLPTIVPIIATGVWCVLFMGVAFWRFGREEF